MIRRPPAFTRTYTPFPSPTLFRSAKGMRPASLIITESSERLRGPARLRLVTQAESLGLKVACLPKLAEFEHGRVGELDLRYIDMAELLGRPQAVLDSEVVSQAIHGRRVLVTGAGGTIEIGRAHV